MDTAYPTRLFLVCLAVLLPFFSPSPASGFGGCVRFCGEGRDYTPEPIPRPPKETTSRGGGISPKQRRAILIAGKGYKASKQGKEALAEEYYTKAYKIYPSNRSIREGLCVIKVNIGTRLADFSKDFRGALGYFETAQRICPERLDLGEYIGKMRTWMDGYAQWTREKLKRKTSRQKVNFYLEDFKDAIKGGSVPPASFVFASPGTSFFAKGAAEP